MALAGGRNGSELVIAVLGAIPLTTMLLAPIVNSVDEKYQGFRKTLIVYGVLRWSNTIAFWIVGSQALSNSKSDGWVQASLFFIASGTCILCISVVQIASSALELRSPKMVVTD
jgi:hypothetical protein